MESVKDKRVVNGAAWFFLGLSMFATLIGVITNFVTYSTHMKMGIYLNSSLYIVEAILDILILVAGFFTFKKNRYALIALAALFFIRMFATIPWGGDVSRAYMLGGKTVYLLRDFGLFAIAMCFRKNGISGWRAFFASDEWIEEHYKEKPGAMEKLYGQAEQNKEETTTITPPIPEKPSAVVMEQENGASEKAPIAVAQDVDYVSVTAKEPKMSERKKINWKIISGIVVLLAVAVLLIIIGTKSYPPHIVKFGDKFKYFFSISNNSLAEEMFNQYKQTRDAGFDDTAKEYLETAFIVRPNNHATLDSLANTYFKLGVNNGKRDSLCLQRTISLCEKIIQQDNKDEDALSLMTRAQYISGDREGAYKTAESLLLVNPNQGMAINTMCIKAYSSSDWAALKKWGERGYSLGDKTSYQAAIAYYYSKGLYETGDQYKAQKIYEEAIRLNGKHSLRETFTKIGGTPCVIKSFKVQNVTYDNRVINAAGSTFYDDKTQFFAPLVTIEPLRTGYFDFKIKLYHNGTLSKGEGSTNDYSYIHNVLIMSDKNPDGMVYLDSKDFHIKSEKETLNQQLGYWGSDSPGAWGDGVYRYEVWWEDEKLYTYSFNVYSAYMRDIGFGNRFDN